MVFALAHFWKHRLGSVACKEYELEVSKKSIVQREQYFGDVCYGYFRRNTPGLEGFGLAVELDDNCVTKRK